jgi:hypothetical protein
MTLGEMKKKTLGLIEELNPESEFLTDDPDISAKHNDVVNQVQFELAREKKIPRYVEMEVREGDLIDFTAIKEKCGKDVYQLCTVVGVKHLYKASGTVLKVLEDGVIEIDCYVYPERITAETPDSHEFELPADLLEIMPYGVAADLLKSDVSTEYGSIYAARYEAMKQALDPRYALTTVYIEGGVL